MLEMQRDNPSALHSEGKLMIMSKNRNRSLAHRVYLFSFQMFLLLVLALRYFVPVVSKQP